jgi:hypothetical protein
MPTNTYGYSRLTDPGNHERFHRTGIGLRVLCILALIGLALRTERRLRDSTVPSLDENTAARS